MKNLWQLLPFAFTILLLESPCRFCAIVFVWTITMQLTTAPTGTDAFQIPPVATSSTRINLQNYKCDNSVDQMCGKQWPVIDSRTRNHKHTLAIYKSSRRDNEDRFEESSNSIEARQEKKGFSWEALKRNTCNSIATLTLRRHMRAFTTTLVATALFTSVVANPLVGRIDFVHDVPGTSAVVERSSAYAAAIGDPLTKNQRFVSDVWFAVTAQFFDPTFNGLGEDGWRAQKDQALAAVAAWKDSDRDDGIRAEVKTVIDDMLASLGDPYTRYLPQEQLEVLTSYTRGDGGEFGDIRSDSGAGIGVQLLLVPRTSGDIDGGGGDVTVMNTVKDGPAASGGVLVGDVVLEVDGKRMNGATAEFVAAQVRGKEGSSVQLVVQRRCDGPSCASDGIVKRRLSLTRSSAMSKTRSVDSATFVSEYSGSPMGLLRVSSFTQNTASEIATGMQDILTANKNNADGTGVPEKIAAIAIDLRGNVGGYMPAGIDAARNFLPERAAIVAEINSAGFGNFYFGEGGRQNGVDTSTPLYIIVDERTASAAEIFTAALKDNRRAVVVGPTKTFGKGRIQNIQAFDNGRGGITVTTARFITPAGRDIHGVGIKPNKISETCRPEDSAATCLYGLI